MRAELKDVIIAVVGASVAISGLLLIFCGFLFAQAASFPPSTSDKLIDRFRRVARFGLIPLLGALLDAGFAFRWMLSPSPVVYLIAVFGFAALLVVTGIYGAVAILLL
jgi:hypothetical protein